MTIGFTHKAVAHLGAAISDSDTQITVHITEYEGILSSKGDYVFLLLRGPVNRELVKVDLALSTWGGFLTITRGAIPFAWPQGSMLFATTHEEHYNEILQRGSNRIVTANPNEVTTPLYAGEKIYQSSPAGCERWWKSFDGSNFYWDLITGSPCGAEAYADVGWDHDILKVSPPPTLYTWTLKKDLSNETPAQSWVTRLLYDPDNGRIIAGTDPDAQIWTSADGGDTWTLKKDLSNETPAMKSIYGLIHYPPGNAIFAGCDAPVTKDGQIWKSTNGGDTWTLNKDFGLETPKQLGVRCFAHDSFNDVLLAGTTDDAQIWASDDGGVSWVLKKDLSDETISETSVQAMVYDSYHKTLVAGTWYHAQLWKSTDGGDTWTRKKDLEATSGQQGVHDLVFDAYHQVIFACTRSGAQIWASDDGGDTWTLSKDLQAESAFNFYAMSLTYDPDLHAVLCGSYFLAQIWATTDGGATWTLIKDLSLETPAQYGVISLAYDSVRKRAIAGTYNSAQLWVGAN